MNIEIAAIVLLFDENNGFAKDEFTDAVIEQYNSSGIYGFDPDTDIRIDGDTIIYSFECDDIDNAEWDEDEEDYINPPLMNVSFFFQLGKEGAQLGRSLAR